MAFFEQLFKVPPLKTGERVKYAFFTEKKEGKPVARVGMGTVVSQPWWGIFVELKPIQPSIPLVYLSKDGTFTAPRGSVFSQFSQCKRMTLSKNPLLPVEQT